MMPKKVQILLACLFLIPLFLLGTSVTIQAMFETITPADLAAEVKCGYFYPEYSWTANDFSIQGMAVGRTLYHLKLVANIGSHTNPNQVDIWIPGIMGNVLDYSRADLGTPTQLLVVCYEENGLQIDGKGGAALAEIIEDKCRPTDTEQWIYPSGMPVYWEDCYTTPG